jgi:hypothetical protein
MNYAIAEQLMYLLRAGWRHSSHEYAMTGKAVSEFIDQFRRRANFPDRNRVYPDNALAVHRLQITEALRPAEPVSGVANATPQQIEDHKWQKKVDSD